MIPTHLMIPPSLWDAFPPRSSIAGSTANNWTTCIDLPGEIERENLRDSAAAHVQTDSHPPEPPPVSQKHGLNLGERPRRRDRARDGRHVADAVVVIADALTMPTQLVDIAAVSSNAVAGRVRDV